MSDAPGQRLVERIHRQGPIPFDAFMEAALYDPDGGFFTAGGGAGRSGGDFLTSPEVGSLFGALVARALDGWWHELGEPDPFVIVDAGAGRGQLARDVLRAKPRCTKALRYVMVERSPRLRRRQHEHLDLEPPDEALGPSMHREKEDDDPEPVPGTGPIVTQTEELPAIHCTGVVVANELLDNLPFRVVERGAGGRWLEVRVGVDDASGRFGEVPVPADDTLAALADDLFPDVGAGARLPVQTGLRDFLDGCGRLLRRGFVAVLDYAAPAAALSERGQDGWLRTYRGHERGGSPLDAPGAQDITADVALETLRDAATDEGFTVVAERLQAEWLRELGIDELVEDGRRVWQERAHIGDLEALKGRSLASEAESLLHPSGLGGHLVVVLSKGVPA